MKFSFSSLVLFSSSCGGRAWKQGYPFSQSPSLPRHIGTVLAAVIGYDIGQGRGRCPYKNNSYLWVQEYQITNTARYSDLKWLKKSHGLPIEPFPWVSRGTDLSNHNTPVEHLYSYGSILSHYKCHQSTLLSSHIIRVSACQLLPSHYFVRHKFQCSCVKKSEHVS